MMMLMCCEPWSATGSAALEALRGLKRRNDSAALLLVDQRMPHMTGVEFLGQATALYPDAKRVLLTAYADTDAAIRAINDARIHHYLLKPWDLLKTCASDSCYAPPAECTLSLVHDRAKGGP